MDESTPRKSSRIQYTSYAERIKNKQMMLDNLEQLVVQKLNEDPSFAPNQQTLMGLVQSNPKLFPRVLTIHDFHNRVGKVSDVINSLNSKLKEKGIDFSRPRKSIGDPEKDIPEILIRREKILPPLVKWYAQKKEQDVSFQINTKNLEEFIKENTEELKKIFSGFVEPKMIMRCFRSSLDFLNSLARKFYKPK